MQKELMLGSKSGLIGLLLAMAIIIFFCYIVLNLYFKKPSVDQETERLFVEQGIDVPSQQGVGVLDNTRDRIRALNKQISDRNK